MEIPCPISKLDLWDRRSQLKTFGDVLSQNFATLAFCHANTAELSQCEADTENDRMIEETPWKTLLTIRSCCAMACPVYGFCVRPSAVSSSWRLYGLQPVRLLCPWNSLGENTGVGKPFPSPDVWTLVMRNNFLTRCVSCC